MLTILSSKALVRITAIFGLIFSLVAFNAFTGDSLMYHLPFSVRFWHLSSWPDFSGYFEPRYQGFPVLWRLLLGPGLLLKAPRLLILPNLIAMACLCWCTNKYLKLNWPITVAACLCFPVSLYGFGSSMQDFFVNVCALAGAICLFSSNLQEGRPESRQACLVGMIMLALAANVKLQGLMLAVIILMLTLVFWFRDSYISQSSVHPRPLLRFLTEPLTRLPKLTFITFFLLSLIFAQPLLNIYRFSNPVYPVGFWHFKGHEGTNVSKIPYMPSIPIVYNGLTFLSSSLEIDPIVRSDRGIFFRRTVHMQNPPESDRQPADQFGNRWIITGGSNGFLYLLILSGSIATTLKVISNTASQATGVGISKLQLRLMISFFITLFLPQTLELRYYIYNLLVPCFVAISSPLPQLRALMRAVVVAGLIYSLLASLVAPLYFWSRTKVWLHDSLSWNPLYPRPSEVTCADLGQHILTSKSSNHPLSIIQVKESILCGFYK